MNFRFDKYGNIGVFTFVGRIGKRYTEDIKVLLMYALESMDRVVLNFGKDVEIDREFRELIGSACRISKRMDKPFIMNGYRLKAPDGAIQNAAAIYPDEVVRPLRNNDQISEKDRMGDGDRNHREQEGCGELR